MKQYVFYLLLVSLLSGCGGIIQKETFKVISTSDFPHNHSFETQTLAKNTYEGANQPISLLMYIPLSFDRSGAQQVVDAAASKHFNCIGFKNATISRGIYSLPFIYNYQRWYLEGYPIIKQ